MPTNSTPAPSPEPAGGDEVDLDLAVVVGRLSSDPAVTTLASGSTLRRYEVTVRHVHGTDTVPVVTFDAPRPPSVVAGDRVAVVGRVRRRFFRAGGATRSATEVVATSVTKDGRNRRLVRALEDATVAAASRQPPRT